MKAKCSFCNANELVISLCLECNDIQRENIKKDIKKIIERTLNEMK